MADFFYFYSFINLGTPKSFIGFMQLKNPL